MPRDGAVESERGGVLNFFHDRLQRRIEHRAPDHRQESLHCGIASLRVLQQRTKQGIAGQRRKAGGAEKLIAAEPPRPRAYCTFDAGPGVRICANHPHACVREIAGASPRLRHGSCKQLPKGGIDIQWRNILDAPSEVRLDFGRFRERQRAAVSRHRLVDAAKLVQRIAKIVMHPRVVRSDGNRSSIGVDRRSELALCLQHKAQIAVSRRKIRSQRERVLIAGDCLVQLGLCVERDTQVEMRVDIIRT